VPTTTDTGYVSKPSAEPHSIRGQPTATTAKAKFTTVVGNDPIIPGQGGLEMLATLMFSLPIIVPLDKSSVNSGSSAGQPPVAQASLETKATATHSMHTSAAMLKDEGDTVDRAYKFVIDSQTLTPGGVITIGAKSVLSLDTAASFIVIDGVSTIKITHTALTSMIETPGEAKAMGNVTLVLGDVTATLPGDRLSVISGITTVVPIQAVLVGGSVTTIVPTVAARVVNITLTVSRTTSRIPGLHTSIFGGIEIIVPAVVAPGRTAVTITYGGITAELANGRTTVLGGTTTIVTAPAITTISNSVLEQTLSRAYDQGGVNGQSVSSTKGLRQASQPAESAMTTGTGPDSSSSQLAIDWRLILYILILQNFP
jgi:hypothetical protein